MDFPTGTVTLLFTDVERSTRLAKDLGAARYGEVLDAHRRLLRAAFREAGGIEVDSHGDGFFVAFRSASEAVNAAADAQRALARERWPNAVSLRVRMGIHTGEPAIGDEGYRGLEVHRAARICASAHGGQVLLSSTTRDLIEPDLPAQVRLRELGLAHLRDIDRPERLFQLVVEGLPEDFPPPRAQASRRLLPHGHDLLERDAELAALDALISAAPAGGRLLAIEGPAGIGKTRLIAETRARAQAAGMQVLAARGSELEQEFSYGVVRQLFEPLLASAPQEVRAELLAGAAELATPIFDPVRLAAEAERDSSPAALHGLFWLTANLTVRQVILVAIDDLHWCDPSSLRWLAYLLPRLEGLPLLIVVGLRPAEPGAETSLLRRITADPLATVVRPSALSEQATGELMREVLSAEVDETFRAAAHRETAGTRCSCASSRTRSPSREQPQRPRACPAFVSWAGGRSLKPSRSGSLDSPRRSRGSRRRSRSSATTPISATPPRSLGWTKRPRPMRPTTWHVSRSCIRACLSRSSILSFAPPPTASFRRRRRIEDTVGRRVCSRSRARSRSGSRRNFFSSRPPLIPHA
jgi:class 3 adenylate cyclase